MVDRGRRAAPLIAALALCLVAASFAGRSMVGATDSLGRALEVRRFELFGPRAATLLEAELARRNGDFDGAAAVLRLLVDQGDAATANEALLQLAVVLLEDDRPIAAGDTARQLLGRTIDDATRGRATLLLGRAKRAEGDCPAATAHWTDARPRVPAGLGPYVDLLLAECAARLADRAAEGAYAQRAVAEAGARLTLVEGLEYQVDAATKRGDLAGALQAQERLVAAAGTRAYRARTLTGVGNLNLELGRPEAAARAFATLVAELPETASAPAALEALEALDDLDALGTVGLDQIGLVHHLHGRHGQAARTLQAAVEAGLPPDRAARALHHRGVSLIQLGETDDAVATLVRVADLYPTAELAPEALLRAGRALESDGRLDEAGGVYRRAADQHGGAAAGQEAHYRLVSTLIRRAAVPEAAAAARELAAGGAASRWKGLGLFWAGKALARSGDQAGAEALWRQAADLDPSELGGLRSRAILGGERAIVNAPRGFDAATLHPTDGDRRELADWLRGRGLEAAALEAEQAADGRYARAGELMRLGLREQARWELQEIGASVAADPARLFWLAQFAADRSEPQLGVQFAIEARQATGQPLHVQPKLLQRLIYPLPYADLIVANAQRRGVDPLLFAALVRQESTFNAAARSSADARGLAQVVPPTGHEIARALGRSEFEPEDLYRPIVSVEFGAYYLWTQLEAYENRVYPALAAYNAGGGVVNGWLRDFGGPDPDEFAERIPYPETSTYLRVVYENYRIYQRLYR